jgi:hypothetical protein
MLFSANEFEQYFTSKTLKKGLKLFEQSEVSLIAALPNNSYHFLIESQFDLETKKKGNSVISYSCSCKQNDYCVHLCAVLFYFQKDRLGLSVKDTSVKNSKTSTRSSSLDLNISFKKIDVAKPFSGNRGKKIFKFFRIQMLSVLYPYRQAEALDQRQINQIHFQTKNIIKKFGPAGAGAKEFRAMGLSSDEEKLQQREGNLLFYLYLSILCGLPHVFDRRLLGKEEKILKLLENSKSELDNFYTGGLTKNQSRTWLEATQLAATTKNSVGLNVLSFFVPRSLVLIQSQKNLEDLKNLINKKRQRNKTSNEFDQILIMKLQLAIKESEFPGATLPPLKSQALTEFIIAKADLLFCAQKNEAAFVLLESHYDEVKTSRANFLVSYQNYIIEKAREKNQKQLELKYIEESLVTSLYFPPQRVNRLFQILPKNVRSMEIDRLIEKIKTFSKEYFFDKIAALLLKDNRLDVLILELKKQKNKFNLVHQVALKKLPNVDEDLLLVYTRHLSAILNDAAYDQYHRQIVIKATEFLNKIPKESAMEVVNNVLSKMGSFSRIHKFIRSLYPDFGNV